MRTSLLLNQKDFIPSLRAAAYCLSGFPIKRYLSPAITQLASFPSYPSPSAKCHPDTPASGCSPRQTPKGFLLLLLVLLACLHVRYASNGWAGMKDLVSCFSEHAVRISDVACSGSAAANAAAAAVAATGPAEVGCRAAAMSAVTSVYSSRLSASGKDLLVDVTWSRSQDGPALSVAVHDAGASRHRAAGSAVAAPRHLHRRKGSGTFTAGSCVVGVFWDYAAARYGAGPEPVSGFYVAVVADAEFVLLLGDMSRSYVERLHGGIPIADSRMARRRERFVGCGCWSTKARFLESGPEHEIGVGLEGDTEAWVTVDGRKVVQLRRLRWNFRGSHTLFLDGGAPVDMTWDLHGWLFHALDPSVSSSSAVFTFHARGASETRLWMEDDGDVSSGDSDKEHEKPPTPARGQRQKQKQGGGAPSGQGLCLLIQGFRSSSKIT